MNKRELTEGQKLGIQLFKEYSTDIQNKSQKNIEIQTEAMIMVFKLWISFLSSVYTKKQILEMCLESDFILDELLAETKKISNTH